MTSNRQQEIATPNRKNSPTRIVVYIATMVAVSIVLKLISNQLSAVLPRSLKISLAYLGWYISAAVLGPYYGCAVACVSDLIGQWLIPTGGAPNPILIAGNGLSALIFGLAFRYLCFRKLPKYVDLLLRAVIGAAVAALVCTLGVNTFGLWLYYYRSTEYFAFTVSRLLQLTSVAVNISLFAAVLPVLLNIDLVHDADKNRFVASSTSEQADEAQPNDR
ncbi:MAG: folate family ECF transporter S component [Candidatus Neoclostridium sp.]